MRELACENDVLQRSRPLAFSVSVPLSSLARLLQQGPAHGGEGWTTLTWRVCRRLHMHVAVPAQRFRGPALRRPSLPFAINRLGRDLQPLVFQDVKDVACAVPLLQVTQPGLQDTHIGTSCPHLTSAELPGSPAYHHVLFERERKCRIRDLKHTSCRANSSAAGHWSRYS